jgi:hypothetical protein
MKKAHEQPLGPRLYLLSFGEIDHFLSLKWFKSLNVTFKL